MTDLLTTGPTNALAHLLLAHGAGAGMTSPFLDHMAKLLADRDIRVTRFEFAYMSGRRSGGTRKPPPKMDVLTAEYANVIANIVSTARDHSLVIGGKSMGGRVASLIADDHHDRGAVAGLVCLGYPFHPPKRPEALRTAHLGELHCPALIVQGERDPFGTRDEVAGYRLSKSITLAWMTDGDHDLAPRARSGTTSEQNLAAAANAIAGFLERLPKGAHAR